MNKPFRLTMMKRLLLRDPLQRSLKMIEGLMDLGLKQEALRVYLTIDDAAYDDFRMSPPNEPRGLKALRAWHRDVLKKYQAEKGLASNAALTELGLQDPTN